MRTSHLPKEVFQERRQRLARLIQGSALILPAWPEAIRNNDGHFKYRPESNMVYLTGFDEPGSCLIFRPGKDPETVLFVREKDVEMETWNGFRFGPEGAKKVFGVDEAYTIDQIEEKAPQLLSGCEKVYYSLFKNQEFDLVFSRVMEGVRQLNRRASGGLPVIEDAAVLMGEMRIRKTEVEVEALKKACEISAKAHVEVLKAARPGVSERELHGLFLYSVMKQGAFGEAYNGIFATGDNAVTLHYVFNENVLKDGELLLVDAGAEYLYYSGDITRTYPVNGKFTAPQKAIYEEILAVQKKLIEMCRPGVPHSDLQKETVSGLVDILLNHKILKGSKDEVIESLAYRKYYPHGVSHLLGLDTHDAGAMMVRGQSRPMEAGWALTIEPGLYFPPGDEAVPPAYRGIGIRIEDDILVTQDGPLNMTVLAPKEVNELER
jgi:Xaa-Pro aminopeptidase